MQKLPERPYSFPLVGLTTNEFYASRQAVLQAGCDWNAD
jgi:hypothetical protein